MERIDDRADEMYLNVCVFGATGTGKTSLGVTAPKPLILLSERQGMLHIRQAAKRLGISAPPTILMNSFGDYRQVARALHGDRDEPFRVLASDGEIIFESEWPETIVFDSMTDCCRLVRDELREISPPKAGSSDGLPRDSQAFWGVFLDKVHNLILGFRDAPVNTLFLCLADDRTVGEGADEIRHLQPSMAMRKMPNMLASAVNLQGYSYRKRVTKNGGTKTIFAVSFSGPEHLMVKPCEPLREREHQDFSAWVNAVCGAVAPGGTVPEPSVEEIVPEEIVVEKPNKEKDNA